MFYTLLVCQHGCIVNNCLFQAEASINRISTESQSGSASIEDLLLEAETLLQDMTFVFDLLAPNDSQILLRVVSDVYLWLDERSRQCSSRGRPLIEISESQLALLLSFHFSASKIASMLQVPVSTVRRLPVCFRSQ